MKALGKSDQQPLNSNEFVASVNEILTSIAGHLGKLSKSLYKDIFQTRQNFQNHATLGHSTWNRWTVNAFRMTFTLTCLDLA